MVFSIRPLTVALLLSLPLWAEPQAGQNVLIRLHAEPEDAAVFSSDGSQRYSESALQGFYFARTRLRVGSTTLSQVSFLLRKDGYRDTVASIPSEQILHAPGGTVDWPHTGTLTLAPLRQGVPVFWIVPTLIGLALWRRRRQPSAPAVPAVSGPAPGAPWELQPGSRVGNYLVKARLGEGVSAVVFQVCQEDQPDLPLALKLLKPAESRDGAIQGRFRREMKALSRLRHSNIPYLADYGEHQQLFYLVMEYLPGENLGKKISQGRLSPAEAYAVIGQLASALAAAHKQGVLHRDIKPENVVWGEDSRPRLTDFGLARSHDSTTLTVEGTLLGTPSYMAPELVTGGSSSPASDQYSLCCLAFELLCGRPPFEGESPLSIAVQHVHGLVPDPTELAPGLPVKVKDCLLTGLQKEPEKRFADMEQFSQHWSQAQATA